MKFEKLVAGITNESTGPAQMPLTDAEVEWLESKDWEMIISGRWQKIIDGVVHRVYRASDNVLKHEISNVEDRKVDTVKINNIEDLP